jgi:thiol-disulfide isomerase/thioredoxin
MFLLLFSVFTKSYFPFQPPVIEVTTENWITEVSQYVGAYGVVFALFLKKGSPPCKMIFPDFQEAANKSQGMVKFISIDISANPKLAHLHTVRAVPAFRIIHHKGAKEYKSDSSATSLIEAGFRMIPNQAKSADGNWVPSPNTPLSGLLLTTKKVIPDRKSTRLNSSHS